jgi:hypothetical protein
MLNIRDKLKWCVIGNTSVLLMLIVVIFAFDNDGKYARFGPSDELVVISVKIDTFAKYGALLCFIAVINAIQILSEDIGNPILGFNIFNPDKKHITDFTKNELWGFAVIMFSTGAFRSPLLTLLSISQIDIALFSVMIKEIVGVITIRLLLNEKTYGPAIEEGAQNEELVELVIES